MDKELMGEDGNPCKCGSRFKDTDHSLKFPHSPIRGHAETKSAAEYTEDKKNAKIITNPNS